jgi:hypothetical protein
MARASYITSERIFNGTRVKHHTQTDFQWHASQTSQANGFSMARESNITRGMIFNGTLIELKYSN